MTDMTGKERTRAYHRHYWQQHKHRYSRAMRRLRKLLREGALKL